jgi:PPP family 3-phenylpropionic acid transporter
MIAAPAGTRATLALRLSLLYAAISLVVGSNLPFLPLWLNWAGLDVRSIAVVTALPLIARIALAPAIAAAADRAGDHRRFLIVLGWAALAALLALASARHFWSILACSFLFSLAFTTIVPLAETVTLQGVRGAGLDYGRVRLWGSLTFIGAALAGGWAVGRFGASCALVLPAAGAMLTVGAAQALPRPAPAAAREGRRAAAPHASPGRLLRKPAFLLFLAATGAVQASHAVLYAFATLQWRTLGLSAMLSGLLWAIAIAFEIALFAAARCVVARLGATNLILLGAAASVLRWSAMGLDPPLPVLVPLQALHGLTFAATHLGAMHFIARTTGDRAGGTAQALYAAATSGVFMAAAMLSAGPLYAAWAGRAYWAMAGFAAAGLAAGLLLPKSASARAAFSPTAPVAGGARTPLGR